MARREAVALAVLVLFGHAAAEPVEDPGDEHVRKPDDPSKERSQEPLLRFVEGRLTTRSRHRNSEDNARLGTDRPGPVAP